MQAERTVAMVEAVALASGTMSKDDRRAAVARIRRALGTKRTGDVQQIMTIAQQMGIGTN